MGIIGRLWVVGFVGVMAIYLTSFVAMAAVPVGAKEFCTRVTEESITYALERTPAAKRPTVIQHRDFPGRGYRVYEPDVDVMQEILIDIYSRCLIAYDNE